MAHSHVERQIAKGEVVTLVSAVITPAPATGTQSRSPENHQSQPSAPPKENNPSKNEKPLILVIITAMLCYFVWGRNGTEWVVLAPVIKGGGRGAQAIRL